MHSQAFYGCEPPIAAARVIKYLSFYNDSPMNASFLIHNRYAHIVPAANFE